HHQHGKTPYIALSYVWGDADNQVPILVNNVKLLVRQNLNLALAKLRQERPEAWIWVDAICIDQAHDDEKSWEVNRMRDVFQKAETVFHWLGPAADDSDFLLDWVADLGREASEADVLGFHPPNLSSYRMSKAMEALLQRPFFQRLWIVQELAVSQNGVFLCDSRQLPVDYLESVLALTNRRLPEQTSRILDDLIAKANCDTTSHRWLGGFNRNLIDNPGLMVRRRRHQGDFPSLLSILKCSIATFEMPIFATADPRDLVFGLLGICRDASSLNLRVDYTKSIVQVFTTVTRAFIHNDKEYCLGFSTFPKDLDGLPSWVPDW
ncbi:heterokaryon incompatibility protein-domain-containing protein, partial [Immersiella caudata]